LISYLCAMQNENPEYISFVYSEEVLALVKSANDLATFLEEFSEADGAGFISESLVLLSAVYAAMIRVGECDTSADAPPEPSVSEQDWAALFQKIARLLGAHNEIIRPAEESEYDRSELLTHTISEDLADVYQELRDFTSIYSRGLEELMNDATWELRERFYEHWGKKLLRALSALHDLQAAGTDPTEV
jgi:hypothetical protein